MMADDGELTPSEKALLTASREISFSTATSRGGPGLDAEWQEQVLRAAADVGLHCLEYLLMAVKAQRGVEAWWTPERRKRISGVPLKERPTLEEMLRDLLPAVHPFHFGMPKTDDGEGLRPLVEKSFFVLRAPGVLTTLEVLATRRAAGDSDALEGIALSLDSRLKSPRGKGSKPPSFDERAWDRYSLLSYRLCRADARSRRAWRRSQGARDDLSLDEEAALEWLAEERRRQGDPRPVKHESDLQAALNAVAALKRRVKARDEKFGKQATFINRKD